MDKRFLLILVAIAVVLGGVFFVSNSRSGGSADKGTLTSNIEGASDAKLTLTEYGDYQCPACGQYYAPVNAAVAKYKSQIKFQFRNFPLSSIHPNALAGARAAEAAGKQGKYWEMHDKLYTENYTQQVAQAQGTSYATWINAGNPLDIFKSYASTLKLDTAKFETDYKSSKVNGDVQADIAEGNRLGVNSTPTFFINGKKITNPAASVDGFSKIIEAELKKLGVTPNPQTTDTTAESTGTTPTPSTGSTESADQ